MMAERTTHTPGPWEVFRTDEHIEKQSGVTVYIGDDDAAGRFAAVRGVDLDEDAANARLIAAAPAMLAALKELADAYQFAWKVGGRVDDVDNAATRYKIIADAITKATGADPRVVDYDQENEGDE